MQRPLGEKKNCVPGLRQPDGKVPGLHHFQMRFAPIGDLFDRYEALASYGIMPARSANHGPSTIFYYGDPDDNQLELSASNYLTEPEVKAFLQSEGFRRNPAGIDVDPAEYVGRYRKGVSLEELRRLPEPAYRHSAVVGPDVRLGSAWALQPRSASRRKRV